MKVSAALPVLLTITSFCSSLQDDVSSSNSRNLLLGRCKTLDVQVTVIGGGLAGIFAASVLEQQGITYHLLEAGDYWGGRFSSSEFDGYDVENGASFMIGADQTTSKENPILRLYQNYNDGDGMRVYETTLWDTFMADGTSSDETTVADEQEDWRMHRIRCLNRSGNRWYRQFVQCAENPPMGQCGGYPTPDNGAETILANCPLWNIGGEMDDPSTWVADTDLKSSIAHFFLEQEFGIALAEISRASFPEGSFAAFGRESFHVAGQGSSASTDMLKRVVRDNTGYTRRTLNAKVVSVDQSEDKVVTMAEIGGGCTKEFRSDYVIAAVPINILKGLESNNNIIFTPSLNVAEHPMLQTQTDKVFIKFNQVFWDDDKDWVVVEGSPLENGGKATYFYNLNQQLPGSNMLLTFVIEPHRDILGNLDDSTLEDTLIANLRMIWEEKSFTGMEYSFKTSNWVGNELIDGAWEYWELDVNYDKFFDAIAPEGKVHKAGSAHCFNFWGFTWGAVFSGIQQAEWIANRIANPDMSVEDLEPYSPCVDLDDDGITVDETDAFYEKFNELFVPGGNIFMRIWLFLKGIWQKIVGWFA